jgi:sulfur transfer protein SufE
MDELERFDYLMAMSLSKSHEADDGQRSSKHYIHGCQAGLWVQAKWRDRELIIAAGSDAMLVTALANLIISAVKGCSAEEIAGAEIDFFNAPSFKGLLSGETAASLKNMVDFIKAGAALALRKHM